MCEEGFGCPAPVQQLDEARVAPCALASFSGRAGVDRLSAKLSPQATMPHPVSLPSTSSGVREYEPLRSNEVIVSHSFGCFLSRRKLVHLVKPTCYIRAPQIG
jgi:hypothetical protein